MIYVSDRSADSICVTALLFFVMKSEYMPSHCVGMDSTSVVRCVACLYIAIGAPVVGDCREVSRRWVVMSVVRGSWGAGAIRVKSFKDRALLPRSQMSGTLHASPDHVHSILLVLRSQSIGCYVSLNVFRKIVRSEITLLSTSSILEYCSQVRPGRQPPFPRL